METNKNDLKAECESSMSCEGSLEDTCEPQVKIVSFENEETNSNTEEEISANIGDNETFSYFWEEINENGKETASETASICCKYCDAKYVRRFNLESHLLTKHRDKISTSDIKSKLHTCDLCPFESLRKSEIDEHRAKHNKETTRNFTCDICNFTTFSKKLMTIHQEQHNEIRELKCPFCEKRFKRKRTSLEGHLLTSHRSNIEHNFTKYIYSHIYKCDLCTYMSIFKFNMDLHTTNIHEKYQDDNVVKYNCSECSFETTNRKYLTFHQRKHSNGFITCKFCQEKFKRKTGLDTHLLAKHIDQMTNIEDYITSKVYSCEACKLYTIDKRKLTSHMLSAHANRNSDTKWCCDSCEFVSYNKKHFAMHQKTHTVDGKLVCKCCEKKFKLKKQLDYHLMIHHKKEVKNMKDFITRQVFECDFCDFNAFTLKRLHCHVKSKHTK